MRINTAAEKKKTPNNFVRAWLASLGKLMDGVVIVADDKQIHIAPYDRTCLDRLHIIHVHKLQPMNS